MSLALGDLSVCSSFLRLLSGLSRGPIADIGPQNTLWDVRTHSANHDIEPHNTVEGHQDAEADDNAQTTDDNIGPHDNIEADASIGPDNNIEPNDNIEPDGDIEPHDVEPDDTLQPDDSIEPDDHLDPDEGGGVPANFTGGIGDSQYHNYFNDFWRTFDRYYAVFDIRLANTTWAAVGASTCDDLWAEMGDLAFFEVLLKTAEQLDDGHIQFEAANIGRRGDAQVSEYPHDDIVDQLEFVAETYLNTEELTWGARRWFSWGTIGDVGYLSITQMDDLSFEETYEGDIAAANEAMSLAMQDLGQSRAIIVDVRANGGGWDAVGLEVARWFAGAQTLAWTEQERVGPA